VELCLSLLCIEGTEIFVSTEGSDAVGCGSISSPCGSLAYAVSISNDFDTILLEPGDYQLETSVEITTVLTIKITSTNYYSQPTTLWCQGLIAPAIRANESVFLEGVTIRNCEAGAIQLIGQNNTIESCHFINNSNPNVGGAITVESNVISLVSNSNFTGNVASRGGAVSIAANSNITFLQSVFVNNSAQNSGGAVFSAGTTFISNSTFQDNNSGGKGGALSVVPMIVVTPPLALIPLGLGFGVGVLALTKATPGGLVSIVVGCLQQRLALALHNIQIEDFY
jgi:hypothetical protein